MLGSLTCHYINAQIRQKKFSFIFPSPLLAPGREKCVTETHTELKAFTRQMRFYSHFFLRTADCARVFFDTECEYPAAKNCPFYNFQIEVEFSTFLHDASAHHDVCAGLEM